MSLLSTLLALLFSLAGFLFGIALAYIAPEELKPGKKYFLWLKRILFITIAATITYYFTVQSLWKVIFSLAFIIILILEFKEHKFYKEILVYLSFIIPCFFIEGKLLVASLIFLYGLPAGTLLKQ